MKFAAVLRAPLEELVAEPKYNGDYDHLSWLSSTGKEVVTAVNGENLHQIIKEGNIDAAFFFQFPFNANLSKELIRYEELIPFINRPSGVLKTSEKTYEQKHFKHLQPPTLLIEGTTRRDRESFIREYREVILKPVDGTGGRGIEKINRDQDPEKYDKKIRKLHENAKAGYLLQRYLENKGDARVVCYNGKILGHFGRFNTGITNNISGGGSVIDIKLTEKDREICYEVTSKLAEVGVHYVGVDLLEGYLLEANVACPGGIGMLREYEGMTIHDAFRSFEKETKNIIKKYSTNG